MTGGMISRARKLSGLQLAMLLAALLLAASAAWAAQSNPARTEADLQQLRERIARLQRQTQQDDVQKNRLSRELRDAELSVARAQRELGKVRTERSERTAAREKLAAERAEREAQRSRAQADLATQVRAAYMMGRNEPLKLLLNQRDPAQFGRNLAYYGYLGRERAVKVNLITENIAQIDELTRQIEAEDAELSVLEDQRKGRLAEVEKARKQRGRVLASLQTESRNRGAQLKRLQQQEQQMERLLTRLRREADAVPYDPNNPFAQLRGRLSWPVAGRVEMAFGATVAGNLRSNGIHIAADRGTSVRAIHEGRVEYADWLSGRGLLIILNHGNGYRSLYAHNEQLLKEVGTVVKAGDAIATAGDSGGRSSPGLYFEIRREGKPVDPRGWFRTPAPPAN